MLTATPENLITQLRQYWVMLIVLITLLMLASGIRFSDGSMLLAISSGATIADPVFSNPSTQYVWDAPLKIWLLQLLPSSVIIIAIASAIVAIAPLATTLTRDPLLFWLTLVALFLTPALKISLQNIGVGDGFTVLAIVLAAWTRSHLLIAVMFLMLALWHPQQTFFIGLSFFIGHWLYSHEVDWKMMITVAIVLLLGAILFFVWKDSLAFEYAGREAYMADNLSRFISRNPIANIRSQKRMGK